MLYIPLGSKKVDIRKQFPNIILMDLSKAFDCIKHDLLIAKLDAYGFSHEALCLVNSYLENRHQRVKINGSFSTYKQLFLGVPQGSVLGPLFFNIYINDLLLSLMDTHIYAITRMIQLYIREIKISIMLLQG